ncbi:MT-A70 family protein [Oxytricha trifallax]|uniref:mRNA m(6)A methyltransferase n=1 Tax=Oxytricha trifallax TaxID=1172189 RepID=A0A073HWU3_9SPIT|nr:MT-A70 family protein [Oxytricha trifallax]
MGKFMNQNNNNPINNQDIPQEDQAVSKLTEKQNEMIKQIQNNKQFKSIPYIADVTRPDVWAELKHAQLRYAGRLFDIIIVDPPWDSFSQLATHGFKPSYPLLKDSDLFNMPLHMIQTDGFMILWVVNSKIQQAWDFIHHHGYKYLDKFVWVKTTNADVVHSGNGNVVRHAFEEAWICGKGDYTIKKEGYKPPSVIASHIRFQSQKPDESYCYAENLCPGGYILEVFARNHNLKDGVVSMGNQI